jgi:hypothetical protein
MISPMRLCLPVIMLAYLSLTSNPQKVIAQQSDARKPIMLVTPSGTGAIVLPIGSNWKPESLNADVNGTGLVAQLSTINGLKAQFIVFKNDTGQATAQSCRFATMALLSHRIEALAGLGMPEPIDGEMKDSFGNTVATARYTANSSALLGPVHRNENIFAFAGNATFCGEMHLWGESDGSAQADANMKAALADFHPDLNYQPVASDYFTLASFLFKKSPKLAAKYYKSSLDAMPLDVSYKNPRRIATDQLEMSLSMSGDLKNSRAIAQQAIANDPDYPINYYNLACADAEQRDAANAKIHLQQAFDRRANTIKGEVMPDPTKDDSILKLKKDKTFWAFVETLK